MEPLVLHVDGFWNSPYAFSAFVCLTEKGLPFTTRLVNLHEKAQKTPEFKAKSLTARVPVLEHGDFRLSESSAIVEYLEETFPPPAHPALWPADRDARAHARWLSATMHSSFLKLRESMSFNLCFLPRPPRPTPEALEEAAEMLRLLQDPLERGRGPFLFGAFGAADIMYAPAVVRLTAFQVPTAHAPKTPKYMEEVLSHPPVKRWLDAARALPPHETY